jgi:hypothetical protein
MIDPEINKRLRELAVRIAEERDHDTFTKLVAEFNQLLEGTFRSPDQPTKPKS